MVINGIKLSSFLVSFCSTEQFDEYLLAVLNYFDAFFERLAIENKPKPMAVYVQFV